MAVDFELFVRAEQPKLLRYASALAAQPDEARDLVQDVLARAYSRWDRISRMENPAAYVNKMLTNEFLSWRRRWSVRAVQPMQDEVLFHALHRRRDIDSSQSGNDHSVGVTERDDMDQRLSQLPRRQRAALVLRFYVGLDSSGIANVLGCTKGSARSLISRGLAELRLAAPVRPSASSAADIRPIAPLSCRRSND